MKNILGVVMLAVAASAAAGMVVYWTGYREEVTTVTGKSAVKCCYSVNMQERCIIIPTKQGEISPACPLSITVE
jgi:hypothetical protein